MKHSKKGSRGPRLYFSHFQNRILCAFLLCTLIPIFIIGGISYAVSYNIAKDKILNASISADAQLHTQFDNRLQQVENIADTLQYNMYNLMQADAPMDTLAMLSEIRSNLSMFKTSFDPAYINIFLPDEHMASSESLYFFPVSKLSDFQIPKEVLDMEDGIDNFLICKFTLQPFLENSIMHGLSQKTPEVHISIDLSYGDDTVIIVITDNGIGMAKEQLLELQKTLDEKIVNYEKHFGIGNVNKRISNPYFGNGRISVESCLYEGTSITIEFDQMEKYDEECNDCR